MVRGAWKVPATFLVISLLLSGCRPTDAQTSEASPPAPPTEAVPIPQANPVSEAREAAPKVAAEAEAPEPVQEPVPTVADPEPVPHQAAGGLRTSPPPDALPRTDPRPPPPVEGIEPAPDESRENVPPPAFEIMAQPVEEIVLPAGTRMTLQMETPLSTRTHMAGDVFFATLVDDVLGLDGMVLLFHGTRARGEVLVSRRESSGGRGAELAIEVRELLLPGNDLDVRAEVLEASMERRSSDSDGETAAKVATGAAAGAILGRILGKGGKDALKGAIAGAIAGGAVAYATREGHAVLPEGAFIVVRLLEPVTLPETGGG